MIQYNILRNKKKIYKSLKLNKKNNNSTQTQYKSNIMNYNKFIYLKKHDKQKFNNTNYNINIRTN